MRKLQVSTEYQYKSNGKEYYKVYMSRADGSMVKGTRTLGAFTGSKLKQVQKDMQDNINRGAWSNRE
ncbi:MAG TPA: hypothetical protein VHV10_05000 [Ktedonobacteraceae bacterium]|nr:hypothetical protein [Ktedonobacteraceae bacterium]